MKLSPFSSCLLGAALFCVLITPASAEEPTVADVLDGSTEKPAQATADDKAAADTATQEKATPPPELRKTDKFGRDTPRSSFEHYRQAVEENDYGTAVHYLDLWNLPKRMDVEKGPLYARQLEVILDRKLWVNVHDLSTDPEGFDDDGLPNGSGPSIAR